MTDLPKRELGRTGLWDTMPGYGAMELRGAPRARPTIDEQAETILNAVLDAGINYDERNGCGPQQGLFVAVHNRARGIGDGVKG